MNFRKIVMMVAAAAGTAAFAARPVVSGFSVTEANGRFNLEYTLAEGPAVVVIDITTNGAPVGAGWYANGALKGDFGRVENGARKAVWTPHRALAVGLIANADLRFRVKAYPVWDPPDYLAVPLDGSRSRFYYESAATVPGGVGDSRYKTDILLMKRVRASGIDWIMGASDYEGGHISREHAPHHVVLTNDYYLGVYELTHGQYRHVDPARKSPYPARADANLLPVNGVNFRTIRGTELDYAWPEQGHAVDPASALGRLREQTGVEFDLPTEAQWEFACRAGTTTALYNGRNLYWDVDTTNAASIAYARRNLDDIAWHGDNWADDPAAVANGNSNQLHAVGLKLPNAFGFYDMLGNVTEMCLDLLPGNTNKLDDPYKGADAIEPVGLTYARAKELTDEDAPYDYNGTTGRHARRGGFCCRRAGEDTAPKPDYCRSGWRQMLGPTAGYFSSGLRVACPVR